MSESVCGGAVCVVGARAACCLRVHNRGFGGVGKGGVPPVRWVVAKKRKTVTGTNS